MCYFNESRKWGSKLDVFFFIYTEKFFDASGFSVTSTRFFLSNSEKFCLWQMNILLRRQWKKFSDYNNKILIN